MIARTIAKTDFSEWLNLLRKSFRLIGPVRQGDQINFASLAEGEGPDLSFQNTRLSPKEWVQPASERMFQFSLDPANTEAHILKEVPWDETPRLLLGVRPCDARALNLVRINFETPDYTDPWWKHGRDTLTLIGLGCNQPCSTCFCTSVGSGPFDPAGLDILLTDLGSAYLAQAATEKGAALLQGVPQGTEPSAVRSVPGGNPEEGGRTGPAAPGGRGPSEGSTLVAPV